MKVCFKACGELSEQREIKRPKVRKMTKEQALTAQRDELLSYKYSYYHSCT